MMYNRPETYLKDGLQYCERCHTPRQAVMELPAGLFGPDGVDPTRTQLRVVGCLCKCLTEERDRRREYDIREQKRHRIARLVDNGFYDHGLRVCTFEDADENSEHLAKAKDYVARFKEFKASGIGLMFYGKVGNGKTYMAACIANALIEQLIPVCMTTTTKILNMSFDERRYFLQDLSKYELLIIDDFGIERTSEFALEQVYTVIDERYKSGLPLIVTTNLVPSEFAENTEMGKKRIYSRVREMCQPLQFTGEDRREALRKRKLAEAKKFFAESVV